MAEPNDEVDVLVEPAAGHTVDEVVQRLHEVGAADVQVLAPGFISARAVGDALRALEAIAVVHPKVTKAPPRPR